jgi:hypothetical protein
MATESKPVSWTPGPWFIGDTYCDDEGHPEIPIHASNGRGGECTPASVVLQFPTVEGMQEANARLIAAAPELYAALQMLEAAYGDRTWGTVEAVARAMPAARAALAKARGEP